MYIVRSAIKLVNQLPLVKIISIIKFNNKILALGYRIQRTVQNADLICFRQQTPSKSSRGQRLYPSVSICEEDQLLQPIMTQSSVCVSAEQIQGGDSVGL